MLFILIRLETSWQVQECLVLKEILSTECIGSPDEENISLMEKFDYEAAAFDLFTKPKNLKNKEDYGMFFIAPDRSRKQRED